MATSDKASPGSERRLNEIATFVMGQSPPSTTYNTEGRGLPFLQGKAEFGDVSPQHIKWCSAPLKIAPPGAILVSVRAPVGDVNLANDQYCIGRGLAAVVCNEGCDPEFLFFSLLHGKSRLESQGTGTTFQSINKGVLENFVVWAPEYSDQRAIAGVLSAIQEAKEASKRVLNASREFKRSLMRHFFTYGPVSVEEAEGIELQDADIGRLPAHWTILDLGQLLTQAQYGLSLRGERIGAHPILRMNNISSGRIDGRDLQYVNLDATSLSKFKLQSGDLLFNRTNSYELVGKTALFDEPGDWVFASYLIRVKTDGEVLDPSFLNYYLNWGTSQARLRMLATRGVSQSNISATKLKTFVIALPPLHEQARIVETLTAVDAKIDAESARWEALDQLFNSAVVDLIGRKRSFTDLETAHG